MRLAVAAVASLVLFVIASLAHAAACDGFADVDTSNATYCTAITYLKDKGITAGCDATHYCPNDYVTRLQMALFLQRAGKESSTNYIGSTSATIGGGTNNSATGEESTVSGGDSNSATALGSTVIGGAENYASGNYAVVLGGVSNTATAEDAIAAGYGADADQYDCALFNLWGSLPRMNCFGSSSIFRIGSHHGLSVDYGQQRADGGGTRFVALGDVFSGQTIGTWTGAFLSDGGTWTNSSDRNAKTDIVPIDVQHVLDQVAAMPISTWRYKTEADQIHLGPMAQDFHAAFGLGADDRHITTIDEGGVALAAIQALNAKLEAKEARISELTTRLEQVEALLAR